MSLPLDILKTEDKLQQCITTAICPGFFLTQTLFAVMSWDPMKYWIGTAHPLFRLPVFFMGVCAGVLCNRIQQGDLDAFHSKFEFHKDQNLNPSWNVN